MPPKQVQYVIEERSAISDIRTLPESDQETHCGKSIATVQVCMRCGKKFPFKRGRKHCSICQGLLRTKTTVLKGQ